MKNKTPIFNKLKFIDSVSNDNSPSLSNFDEDQKSQSYKILGADDSTYLNTKNETRVYETKAENDGGEEYQYYCSFGMANQFEQSTETLKIAAPSDYDQ